MEILLLLRRSPSHRFKDQELAPRFCCY